MSEFSSIANLEVQVDESSLRQVNREIERGVSDPTVSVSSATPDGSGGGGGAGRFALQTELLRRTLIAQQASADFDEKRNEILEDMLEALQGGIPGGGGGGGPGLGGTLLQVQGARSVLSLFGGVGAGLGLGALGAGGAAAPFLAAGGAALGTGALANLLLDGQVTGGRSPATRETTTNIWRFLGGLDFGIDSTGQSPATRQTTVNLGGITVSLGGTPQLNPNLEPEIRRIVEAEFSTIESRLERHVQNLVRPELSRPRNLRTAGGE